MAQTMKFSTFNCRGIGNCSKRRAIFKWLKHFHKDVVLLQETHSVEEHESNWKKEWKGDIYFSHGSSKSCGVAILIPAGLEIEVNEIKTDKEGRILILNMTLQSGRVIVGNVYFPTRDHPNEQLQTFTKLRALLNEINQSNSSLVIGGDFNICPDPEVDKIGSINVAKSKVNRELELLKDDLNLIDVWPTLHPDSTRCTHRQMSQAGLVQTRIDFWLISTFMLFDIDECEIHCGLKSDHSLVKLCFKLADLQPRVEDFLNSMAHC